MRIKPVLLAAVAGLSIAAGEPALLEVRVDNVSSSQGRVVIRLCQQSEWLKPCRIERAVAAVRGTTVILVSDVPQGRYGVTAYHDRDGDGTLDRNFIGMPSEAIGFSNNALKGVSKPKFADAALNLTSGRHATTLRLRSF